MPFHDNSATDYHYIKIVTRVILINAEYVKNWSCQIDNFFGIFMMSKLIQEFGATFCPDRTSFKVFCKKFDADSSLSFPQHHCFSFFFLRILFAVLWHQGLLLYFCTALTYLLNLFLLPPPTAFTYRDQFTPTLKGLCQPAPRLINYS